FDDELGGSYIRQARERELRTETRYEIPGPRIYRASFPGKRHLGELVDDDYANCSGAARSGRSGVLADAAAAAAAVVLARCGRSRSPYVPEPLPSPSPPPARRRSAVAREYRLVNAHPRSASLTAEL